MYVAWLAGTVMFLGKAVVLSTIILLLVQFIANTETCYLHTGVDKLPSHFQKILLDKSTVMSYFARLLS